MLPPLALFCFVSMLMCGKVTGRKLIDKELTIPSLLFFKGINAAERLFNIFFSLFYNIKGII